IHGPPAERARPCLRLESNSSPSRDLKTAGHKTDNSSQGSAPNRDTKARCPRPHARKKRAVWLPQVGSAPKTTKEAPNHPCGGLQPTARRWGPGKAWPMEDLCRSASGFRRIIELRSANLPQDQKSCPITPPAARAG